MSKLVGAELATVTVVVLLLTSCSSKEQLRYRVVKNPMGGGVVLAHDLPALQALLTPRSVPPSSAALIPNGAKAITLDRKYLRGGRLVEPYAANTYDMIRDRAVQVELIEIRDGPFQYSVGWAQSSCLQPDFPYL